MERKGKDTANPSLSLLLIFSAKNIKGAPTKGIIQQNHAGKYKLIF